jgi:hypothetical protein
MGGGAAVIAARLTACAAGLAVALLGLAPAHGGGPAREPVELSVLTYNLHGLPAWIAGDDPAARLPVALEKAGAFDLVLIQENWAFRELVEREKRHPLRILGESPRRGWLGRNGSGLELLARGVDPRERHSDGYGVCFGVLGGANDCFANKGFLMARLALAGGGEIDVWNTHLDAGGSPGDQAARAAQLGRLAARIAERSAGRALILGGDFNLEWDAAPQRALLEDFLSRTGLSLAAATPPGAWNRRLDYLLLRSGAGTTLEVTEAGMADGFVTDAGAPLSDHPPVYARVRVR